MRTKKKKQSSNKTLPLLIIAVLIGLMAYKYRLLDEKFLKGLPDIIPTEQTSALPSSAPADALEIPVMQSRTGGQLIKRKGYTLSYNADYKTPQWVAWELTGKETKGKEERTDKFLPDPDVRGAKAYSNDYTKSGYDRGHMAPAADMKWSKQAMAESFYMSNICPQNPNLNRRGWKNLEEKIRDWAVADSAIIIICGPIIDKPSKTIGKNKVAVPERFFKVILSPFVKPARGIGFLFNNRQAVEPLSTYAVSIDSIEKLTHMDFFSPLPDELENAVEANADYYQWPR